MADETEIAYFAGFFDGEGTLGIYNGRHVVCLANTDARPLRRAQELWGGHLYRMKRQKYAVRDIWHWNIYGHAARPFLEAILPHSQLKKEQVEVFLAVLPHVPVGRGTRRRPGATDAIDAAALRLRELKRGVAA